MEVQILLGSDYEMEFLFSDHKIQITRTVYLRNTIVGWTFAGRHKKGLTFMSDPITASLNVESNGAQKTTIQDITQFYESEKIGIKDDPSTNEEDTAIKHFYDSLKYENERYSVSVSYTHLTLPTIYSV